MNTLRLRFGEFDAVRWMGGRISHPVPNWLVRGLHETPDKPGGLMRIGNEVHVGTDHGPEIAKDGDWICRSPRGRLFVLSDQTLQTITGQGEPI